jgi:hypothetical protein
LTEGDPVLFNLYGSILVNPANGPTYNSKKPSDGRTGSHRGPVLMRLRHIVSMGESFSFQRDEIDALALKDLAGRGINYRSPVLSVVEIAFGAVVYLEKTWGNNNVGEQ